MTERFTDQFLRYAKEFTDCPDIFLTWGALLSISGALSRSVYVEIGSWNIAPHIWVVLIGKSSSHKSTAISIAEDLIQGISVDRAAPHEFTSEAILQSLHEQPVRFFIFDEAKGFFDMLGKKYNESLKSLFTILYRKPTYTRNTLKHGLISIQNAYLPMGMATTPEWLRQSLKDAEQSAMSGFLARFLMIPYSGNGNKPMPKPPPHDPEKFDLLKDKLSSIMRIARPYSYSSEADFALSEWYVSMTDRENSSLPVLGPFFEHLKNEAIHKISVLMAIDRGEDVISLSAFKEAVLALSYIEEQLPKFVDEMTAKDWDRERAKIMAFLSKIKRCKREELADEVFIHGNQLTAHLKGLEADGVISLSTEKGRTRPFTVIEWTKGNY